MRNGWVLGALCLSIWIAGCGADQPTGQLEFTVPDGASFAQVTDTLTARGLVRQPRLFRALARLRGNDRQIRAGRYSVTANIRWVPLLDQLVAGRVVTIPVTIPEGFTLRQMAPRLAVITGTPEHIVLEALLEEGAAERWGVPGPGLEGYLFPDTYRFAPGAAVDVVLSTMVQRYHTVWTPERRARAEELSLSEREVMALAAVVQGEARQVDEMPTISSVFHNRLRIGIPLQADPTVQYALGERRARLLYSDIDSVADHPYNTYTQLGLPPGPIGAAGEAAIDAALHPADLPYLYFVARPDGSHIFTSSLEEHNRARVEARREWDALARENRERDQGGS